LNFFVRYQVFNYPVYYLISMEKMGERL